MHRGGAISAAVVSTLKPIGIVVDNQQADTDRIAFGGLDGFFMGAAAERSFEDVRARPRRRAATVNENISQLFLNHVFACP
jgi:hypothetical protein